MKRQPQYLFAIAVFALVAVATYRFAIADDNYNPRPSDIQSFAHLPCLVTFDMGAAKGMQKIVLVGAAITDIGGKRFLEGTVSDKFPESYSEVDVALPGKPAYISLERVAFIQVLDTE